MSYYELDRYKQSIRDANTAMTKAQDANFSDASLHDLSAAVGRENAALIEFLGRTDLPEKLPSKAARVVLEVTGIDPRVRRMEVVRSLKGLQGALDLA